MLLRESKIRLFSYFLRSLVLKPIADCFPFYQQSIWPFWFSAITSFLRFTYSESKWARNPVATVWAREGRGRGGRGGLGLIFAGYVPLASQSPYPIIVYSVANYNLNEDELVTCAAWRFWSGAQTSQGGWVQWAPPRGDNEVVMRNSVIAKLSSEVRMQVEISIECLSLLAFAKGKQGLYDYDSEKSNINSVWDLWTKSA